MVMENKINKTRKIKNENEPIIEKCNIPGYEDFYKEDASEKIWKTNKIGEIGGIYISFDKKKIYNLFKDYPHNMTKKK